MKKALRDRLDRDCKRLILESKRLISLSRELLKPDVADESEVFDKTKRKSKAASSRDTSRRL
jgi:hypothetical protein